jgi:hypothetical protein
MTPLRLRVGGIHDAAARRRDSGERGRFYEGVLACPPPIEALQQTGQDDAERAA